MTKDHVVRIGKEAMLPDSPRSHFCRQVNDAPADGERVDLNPPRFRWSYFPPGSQTARDVLEFVFQVAPSADFATPAVNVRTPFNFYNALSPLEGQGQFYWRVGYLRPSGKEPSTWSPVRTFRIAPAARAWDRSAMAKPDFSGKPHPRILLSEANRAKLLKLVESDPECRLVLAAIRARVDQVLFSSWYLHFPATDTEEADETFLAMAGGLCHIAFLYRLTGEKRYRSVIERAVTLAGYPKGGRASPEPMGESHEDSTQITEFLALLYDWLWPDLTEAQRRVFAESLRWRIDHFVNHFSWKQDRDSRQVVSRYGSLATESSSHGFEGFWDTFPAALASYEDSAESRECFHLGVNWLVGVSCGHGFDEGWNEGPGYSSSKFNWLLHSAVYLDSVFPEYQVGLHPWFGRIGEWLCRVTPVGTRHAPWGHGSNREGYYRGNRLAAFRPLAYLTGDGLFLRNWRESRGKLTDTRRLWIQLALPALHPRPQERLEADPVGVFPLAGWVMVGTKPPSSAECYQTSVGMVFQCRPAGAYSHSFASENSFHIYGYGEDLTHGAGTGDYEPHAFHSMSHNTILIDGLGQTQRQRPGAPRSGFLRAFQRGAETGSYMYWAGDATNAYPAKPGRAGGWWGQLDKIYAQRDARHLQRLIRHVVFLRGRYFILLDDLGSSRPARFSWLYHILPKQPIQIDRPAMTIDYQVGKVPVRVVHIAARGDLELVDMKGPEGFKNPLTGEDYSSDHGRGRPHRAADLIAGHNLYITNKTPSREFHFLSVIAPVRPGEVFPAIRRLDEWTVQVGQDVVSFDPATPHEAGLIIDVPALRADPAPPAVP